MSTLSVERGTEREGGFGRVRVDGGPAAPSLSAVLDDLAGYEAADGREIVLRIGPATLAAWCWRPCIDQGRVGIVAGTAAALLAPARLAGWAWRRWVRRDLGRWRLALVARASVVPVPGELVGLQLRRFRVRPVRIGGGA